MEPQQLVGFLDELEKISAAHGRMRLSKSRSGRRPISVSRLLKKEKDGTLWKGASLLEALNNAYDRYYREAGLKVADSQGNPQDVRGSGADDPGAAKLPRRLGEVPTKEPNTPQSAKLGTVRGDVSPLPVGEAPNANPEARKPRKKGDVPSLDDVNAVDRYDGRDSATTVHGLGQSSSNIGAMNHPTEHY